MPGALLVTAGLSLTVFALLGKGVQPWASAAVLVPLACGLALVGLFVAAEARAENPLVPLRFFRSGTRSAANAVFVLANGAMIAMYFSLSLYMQQVIGLSALLAGLAYLPLCAAFLGSEYYSMLLANSEVRTISNQPVPDGRKARDVFGPSGRPRTTLAAAPRSSPPRL